MRAFAPFHVHAGSAAIRNPRVGRVHIAGRVDIPDVVRVVAVGRATEAVLRICSLQPEGLFVVPGLGGVPGFDRRHRLVDEVVPVDDPLRPEMEASLREPYVCL